MNCLGAQTFYTPFYITYLKYFIQKTKIVVLMIGPLTRENKSNNFGKVYALDYFKYYYLLYWWTLNSVNRVKWSALYPLLRL